MQTHSWQATNISVRKEESVLVTPLPFLFFSACSILLRQLGEAEAPTLADALWRVRRDVSVDTLHSELTEHERIGLDFLQIFLSQAKPLSAVRHLPNIAALFSLVRRHYSHRLSREHVKTLTIASLKEDLRGAGFFLNWVQSACIVLLYFQPTSRSSSPASQMLGGLCAEISLVF
jgi:hypothetical protein